MQNKKVVRLKIVKANACKKAVRNRIFLVCFHVKIIVDLLQDQ